MLGHNTKSISKARRAEINDEAMILLVDLWRKNSPSRPLDVVSPGMALEHLGYTVRSRDLGHEYFDDAWIQVAGLIDFEQKEVLISTRISREEQFFTAAHELGHAVLHPGQGGLHRDRPAKGPALRTDVKEVEADYFASCFSMPEKLMRKSFAERFLVDQAYLDQRMAQGLYNTGVSNLSGRIRSDRDFSRILAECDSYERIRFLPLKSEYLVSTEAMAIRLEELKLTSLRKKHNP